MGYGPKESDQGAATMSEFNRKSAFTLQQIEQLTRLKAEATVSEPAKHTPGPWEIDGNTVYALTEYFHKGKPVKANRFWLHIYAGHACSDEERDFNAALIARAPEMAERISELESQAAEYQSTIEQMEQLLLDTGDVEQCCACRKWCKVESMLCPSSHPKDADKLCCSDACCERVGR